MLYDLVDVHRRFRGTRCFISRSTPVMKREQTCEIEVNFNLATRRLTPKIRNRHCHKHSRSVEGGEFID